MDVSAYRPRWRSFTLQNGHEIHWPAV